MPSGIRRDATSPGIERLPRTTEALDTLGVAKGREELLDLLEGHGAGNARESRPRHEGHGKRALARVAGLDRPAPAIAVPHGRRLPAHTGCPRRRPRVERSRGLGLPGIDVEEQAAAGSRLLQDGVVAQAGRHRLAVDVVATRALVSAYQRFVLLAVAVLRVGLEVQEVRAHGCGAQPAHARDGGSGSLTRRADAGLGAGRSIFALASPAPMPPR
jgi:hypothetical protein